jgi:hypothetical protein
VGAVNEGLQIYSKVNAAIDLVMGLRELFTMFDGDLTASIPRSFPTRVNFSDAAAAFSREGLIKARECARDDDDVRDARSLEFLMSRRRA